MFEALKAASTANKYDITWVELSTSPFKQAIQGWFLRLDKSSLTGGPTKDQRVALANEFYRLLHIQKMVLKSLRSHPYATRGEVVLSSNIAFLAQEYQRVFGSALATPAAEQRELKDLLATQGMLEAKLSVLDAKRRLLDYWINGAKNFPKHQDDLSLMFQYMGNAPTEKARLFAEVLCSDAQKMVSLKDPILMRSFEVTTRQERNSEIEWTDEIFKKAVKAEATAGYGVKAAGAVELNMSGLKAKLSGEVWAGARAKASGEASYVAGEGVTVKGSVEAEIGFKMTANASIDVADIFLLEASAEAFAGALARAEVEVTATSQGVTVKLSAEAFAGVKLTGKGSMTLKFQGYELVKGEAEASLTAGIGAQFGMEFSSTLFGGTSFGITSGLTVGVGMQASTKITVNANNIGPAFESLFYTTYLSALGESDTKKAYVNHFRGIGDNVRIFEKAKGIIEKNMEVVVAERQQAFSQTAAFQQLAGLNEFRRLGTVSTNWVRS